MDEQEKQTHRTIYSEVCANYRAIDDFRGKLLALMPLASGGAGILLLSEPTRIQYLSQIGLFGLAVTLALFIYEMRGMLLCDALIRKGRQLERLLEVKKEARQFDERLHGRRIFSVPVASGLIYLAVALGWSLVFCVGRDSCSRLFGVSPCA